MKRNQPIKEVDKLNCFSFYECTNSGFQTKDYVEDLIRLKLALNLLLEAEMVIFNHDYQHFDHVNTNTSPMNGKDSKLKTIFFPLHARRMLQIDVQMENSFFFPFILIRTKSIRTTTKIKKQMLSICIDYVWSVIAISATNLIEDLYQFIN